MGRGRGQGPRPESEDDPSFYDSQVRQKVGKGTAVMVDLVDGPNTRGQVQQAIEQQVDATRRGDTDPLTSRRIPKRQREHSREYFDRFREGEPAE